MYSSPLSQTIEGERTARYRGSEVRRTPPIHQQPNVDDPLSVLGPLGTKPTKASKLRRGPTMSSISRSRGNASLSPIGRAPGVAVIRGLAAGSSSSIAAHRRSLRVSTTTSIRKPASPASATTRGSKETLILALEVTSPFG